MGFTLSLLPSAAETTAAMFDRSEAIASNKNSELSGVCPSYEAHTSCHQILQLRPLVGFFGGVGPASLR